MAAVKLRNTSLFFDANLKGYWEFENNLLDSSPSGYNLTDHSTSDTASGKFDRGRSMVAASSQYADIANASCPNLEISGSQSWGCWVNPSTVNNNTPMGKTDAAGTVIKRLFITNLGKPQFLLTGLTTNAVVTADDSISTGQFYFLVGVYDSVNSLLKIFVNGVKKEVTASGSATATGAAFSIGRQGDLDGTYLDGIEDDSWIFDRALTDQEVSDLYTGALATTTSTSTTSTSSSTSTTSTSSSTSTTSTSSSTSTTTSTSSSTSTTSTSSSTSTTTSSSSSTSTTSTSTTITLPYHFSVESVFLK